MMKILFRKKCNEYNNINKLLKKIIINNYIYSLSLWKSLAIALRMLKNVSV